MIYLVLGCSVALQLTAAFMAFRLIKLTDRYIAWVLIATALFFMAIRRIIPLYLLISGDPSFRPEPISEVIGLVLSILLVIGIAKITPVFSAIKQSVKAARNAEEKYRRLLEHANDAIYLVDKQTMRILDCNKKATEMIGYSAHELQMMIFTELVPNLERALLKHELAEIDNEKINPQPLVLHHIKKNGSYIIVEMNVSLIEVKGEHLILGISRDITERKHNEDKLKLFFQATDHSVVAISLSDLDRRIIYVNHSFEKMFGYSKDKVVGRKTSVLYSEETGVNLQQGIQTSKDGSWVGELLGKREDGSHFCLMVSSSQILNDDGTVIARMTTHRDISEVKQTEEKMIAYTEQLRSLSAHLATVREEERLLLAREIHDGFGSSLTGLKMDLMMLKRNLMEKCTEQVNPEILENFKSMSDLIDNTIVLMRRLVRELRPEVLDELGLVEAVKWYISEFEKRSSIKFHLTVFPKNLKTDPDRSIAIFRIFQEILINIARHSQATEVNVFLRKQKDIIHLLIHDNGIGIKQEEISNNRSLGILGMKERALIFGGDLQIEGEAGQGTTVKVEIPFR